MYFCCFHYFNSHVFEMWWPKTSAICKQCCLLWNGEEADELIKNCKDKKRSGLSQRTWTDLKMEHSSSYIPVKFCVCRIIQHWVFLDWNCSLFFIESHFEMLVFCLFYEIWKLYWKFIAQFFSFLRLCISHVKYFCS